MTTDGTPGASVLAVLRGTYAATVERLLLAGSTPQATDEAMIAEGFSTGPCALQDEVGLSRILAESRGVGPSGVMLSQLVEMGRLGRAAKAGWYRYDADGIRSPDAQVVDLLRETAQQSGIARNELAAGQSAAVLTLALIGAAAELVAAGRASAVEVDAVALTWLRCPPAWGGLLREGDRIGPLEAARHLRGLRLLLPGVIAPTPTLEACAASGRSLRGLTRDSAKGCID